MTRLAGKIAIVTGGARGIGKATAQLFAEQGAAACIVDLPTPELQETVSEIEKEGGKAFAFEADVGKEEEVAAFVRATEEKYGGVDILFNNAGISGTPTSPEELPGDAFDRVMNVNVKGVWLGMEYAAKAMKRRGGGAIVNNSSTGGLRPIPKALAYVASKHAVVGMTKAAALELAPANIRVNAVCPGMVQTRLIQQLADLLGDQGIRQVIETTIPMRRLGQSEEVANLVSFLSSDEASFITGGIYTVDGGYTAT